MYYQEHSTSSPMSLPHLQNGCQLSPDTFICVGKASPLELEVRMCIPAVDLDSTFLQDYALMKIAELLERGVNIENFAKAVEIAFVSDPTGPGLLQQTLATNAAYREHT